MLQAINTYMNGFISLLNHSIEIFQGSFTFQILLVGFLGVSIISLILSFIFRR